LWALSILWPLKTLMKSSGQSTWATTRNGDETVMRSAIYYIRGGIRCFSTTRQLLDTNQPVGKEARFWKFLKYHLDSPEASACLALYRLYIPHSLRSMGVRSSFSKALIYWLRDSPRAYIVSYQKDTLIARLKETLVASAPKDVKLLSLEPRWAQCVLIILDWIKLQYERWRHICKNRIPSASGC
jgi:hypothetical protein